MKKLFSPIRIVLLSLCVLGTALTSCSQEEIDKLVNQQQNNNNNPTPTPTSGSIPLPEYADAHGVLAVTKAKTVQSGVSISVGVATAAFYTNAGDSVFADAGTVKVESKDLTKQSNNAYAFVPSTTEPTGISFTNPISWEVSGNGSVTAFNHDLTGSYPDADSVTSALTFDNNSAYTLTASGITGADSVLFMVVGSSGAYVIKYLGGSATSCTFTQAEMGTIPAGSGLVQVVPMKITSTTTGGRKYYFVRQTSVSKSVTIND